MFLNLPLKTLPELIPIQLILIPVLFQCFFSLHIHIWNKDPTGAQNIPPLKAIFENQMYKKQFLKKTLTWANIEILNKQPIFKHWEVCKIKFTECQFPNLQNLTFRIWYLSLNNSVTVKEFDMHVCTRLYKVCGICMKNSNQIICVIIFVTTYSTLYFSQKLLLFFILKTEVDRVLDNECSLIRRSRAVWMRFSTVWRQMFSFWLNN